MFQGLIQNIDLIIAKFAELMWGLPLLILLSGGGLFFTFYCRLIPFYHIRHGFNILIGKYDNSNDPGQISHFQALSSALASTVGMGNISGVAVAIHMGGPGAIFWMWITERPFQEIRLRDGIRKVLLNIWEKQTMSESI